MFVGAGAADVRTYIQSGNVLFTAAGARAEGIARTVARAIAGRLGFQAPVIVRAGAELERMAAANPYLPGAEERFLHVAFLASKPEARRIAALDPNRSPGDEFRVVGREVYLLLRNGVARTKLTNAYLDAALGTISTLRNWRTVLKLVELARLS
jgi:uncharacterized protein (DUF1697 family)